MRKHGEGGIEAWVLFDSRLDVTRFSWEQPGSNSGRGIVVRARVQRERYLTAGGSLRLKP